MMPAPEPDDSDTGLPVLRSWRAVYLFVLGCFATYVTALAIFGRYLA